MMVTNSYSQPWVDMAVSASVQVPPSRHSPMSITLWNIKD